MDRQMYRQADGPTLLGRLGRVDLIKAEMNIYYADDHKQSEWKSFIQTVQ